MGGLEDHLIMWCGHARHNDIKHLIPAVSPASGSKGSKLPLGSRHLYARHRSEGSLVPMKSRKRDSPHRRIVTASAAPIGRHLMDTLAQRYQVCSMATIFGTHALEESCDSIFGAQREVGK